eukprot:6460032-Amphidinium_carterae.2
MDKDNLQGIGSAYKLKATSLVATQHAKLSHETLYRPHGLLRLVLSGHFLTPLIYSAMLQSPAVKPVTPKFNSFTWHKGVAKTTRNVHPA